MAIIQGRQQQTAIPTTHATATQITTKNTSNAKNVIHNLKKKPCINHHEEKKTLIFTLNFIGMKKE